MKLGWLPVNERISSCLANLAHKALHDQTWPSYLRLSKVVPRDRLLRSNQVPQVNVDITSAPTGTFVECAGNCFNSLPQDIKQVEDEVFKRKCFNYFIFNLFDVLWKMK